VTSVSPENGGGAFLAPLEPQPVVKPIATAIDVRKIGKSKTEMERPERSSGMKLLRQREGNPSKSNHAHIVK
jgi:hypothetical protein